MKGDFNLEQMRRSSGHRKIAIFRIFKKIAIFDFLENMAEMTNFPLSGTFWGVKKNLSKSPQKSRIFDQISKKPKCGRALSILRVFPKIQNMAEMATLRPNYIFQKKIQKIMGLTQ